MVKLEDIGGLFQTLWFYDFKLCNNTSTKLLAYRGSACMWIATDHNSLYRAYTCCQGAAPLSSSDMNITQKALAEDVIAHICL